jgi:hypothetical protein
MKRDKILTHVHRELTQVRVELTGEAKAGGDTGHDDRDEAVKIRVLRLGELERAEADVVQGFVIDTDSLVRVLNELVHGERRVVGLDNGVGHLR